MDEIGDVTVIEFFVAPFIPRGQRIPSFRSRFKYPYIIIHRLRATVERVGTKQPNGDR